MEHLCGREKLCGKSKELASILVGKFWQTISQLQLLVYTGTPILRHFKNCVLRNIDTYILAIHTHSLAHVILMESAEKA